MPHAIHISLPASDLAASVDFYRRFLGVGPNKERPGYARFLVADPPLNLALNAVDSTAPGGVHHLGVQVQDSDSVWRRREAVESAGLSTRTEENVDCCYAVQDKFWVTDPDGVEWEVFTVKDEAGAVPAAEACCAPDCCD